MSLQCIGQVGSYCSRRADGVVCSWLDSKWQSVGTPHPSIRHGAPLGDWAVCWRYQVVQRLHPDPDGGVSAEHIPSMQNIAAIQTLQDEGATQVNETDKCPVVLYSIANESCTGMSISPCCSVLILP